MQQRSFYLKVFAEPVLPDPSLTCNVPPRVDSSWLRSLAAPPSRPLW